ncbi:hypothetical protein Tco_0633780 [Tanacetum coccineum]
MQNRRSTALAERESAYAPFVPQVVRSSDKVKHMEVLLRDPVLNLFDDRGICWILQKLDYSGIGPEDSFLNLQLAQAPVNSVS